MEASIIKTVVESLGIYAGFFAIIVLMFNSLNKKDADNKELTQKVFNMHEKTMDKLGEMTETNAELRDTIKTNMTFTETVIQSLTKGKAK